MQRKHGVDHPKTLAALLDFASFTNPSEAEQLYTDALHRYAARKWHILNKWQNEEFFNEFINEFDY